MNHDDVLHWALSSDTQRQPDALCCVLEVFGIPFHAGYIDVYLDL